MISAAVVCLALTLYHEARGEGAIGMLAVGQVVMNRVNDPRWPNKPCDVVKQGGTKRYKCQLTWYCDGKSDQPLNSAKWSQSKDIAKRLLEGDIEFVKLNNATCYHATWLVAEPSWAKRAKVIDTIGLHKFYEC